MPGLDATVGSKGPSRKGHMITSMMSIQDLFLEARDNNFSAGNML